MGFLSKLNPFKAVGSLFKGPEEKLQTRAVSNFDPNQRTIWNNVAGQSPYFNANNPRNPQLTQETPEEIAYMHQLRNFYPQAVNTTSANFNNARNVMGHIYNDDYNRTGQSFDQAGQAIRGYYDDSMGDANVNFDRARGEMRGLYNPADAMARVMSRFNEVGIPNWQKNVQPLIQSEYAGPGYWGSARANAVKRSLDDLNLQALDTMYATGNEYDMAGANAGAGVEQNRLNSLTQLLAARAGDSTAAEQAKAGTLSNILSNKSANTANLEQNRAMALQELLNRQPELAAEAANLSNTWLDRKNPVNDPYYQQALQMLQLQPIQTIGGTTQKGAGLGYGLISGLSGGVGMGLGYKLAN